MNKGNLVIFKGTAEGIVVILDEQAEFEEVLSCFSDKLKASTQFFQGSQISIRFKGRLLSESEEEELLRLLSNQKDINIAYVHAFESEMQNADDEWEWVKQELESLNGSLTHFHYGMLRSGNSVEYPGNVVVLGDVNPGGQVSAGGNVIILGALKGKVRAGLDARVTRPFVISTVMQPIQIGLGNHMAHSPSKEVLSEREKQGLQIAYLHDDQIYVDVLDPKTLSHMLE